MRLRQDKEISVLARIELKTEAIIVMGDVS
jgi:hypothetical protein